MFVKINTSQRSKPQNTHKKTNMHLTHIHVSMRTGRGVKNKTITTQTIGWIRDLKIPPFFFFFFLQSEKMCKNKMFCNLWHKHTVRSPDIKGACYREKKNQIKEIKQHSATHCPCLIGNIRT